MKLPQPRGLLIGLAIAAVVITVGLVIAQDQESLHVRTDVAATDPGFPEYMARLLGRPITRGDMYRVLTDGPEAFPAMLGAIGEARHRISFEGYIFAKSEIGERFTEAFVAAARRGVAVRLVLDSVGAGSLDSDYIERLESAGVKLGWFNPVADFSIEEVNYRTHRKLLVVDGDVAFVGGIGIDDQWLVSTEEQARWRDTMVEVRGPAAINIEAAFNENWLETGGVVDLDLVPHDNEPDGSATSIVVRSSAEAGANEMKLMYLLALAAAREAVEIQSPYLILDESTRWSIREARERGVRVRMLVEGEITDAKPVKFAGRADYEWLLALGVEVHEYQPAMMHVKAMIVDGLLSIVGSANFDNRSFELNDELNVAVFDREVAAQLLADFESDLSRSRKLDLEEWRSRPLHIKGRETLWSYFGELF